MPYDFNGDGRLELVASVLGAPPARLARPQRRGARAGRGEGWRRDHREGRRAAGPPDGDHDSSAPAWRAATSTATARRTWRSARRGATACPSSTARGAGSPAGRRLQLRGARDRPYGYGALAARHGRRRLRRSARRRARASERATCSSCAAGPDGLSAKRSRKIARPASAARRLRHAHAGRRRRRGPPGRPRRGRARRGRPCPVTLRSAAARAPARAAAGRSSGTDGTSGLAVADVNADGYADIVQGDADHGRTGRPPPGGVGPAVAGQPARPAHDADPDLAGHAHDPR